MSDVSLMNLIPGNVIRHPGGELARIVERMPDDDKRGPGWFVEQILPDGSLTPVARALEAAGGSAYINEAIYESQGWEPIEFMEEFRETDPEPPKQSGFIGTLHHCDVPRLYDEHKMLLHPEDTVWACEHPACPRVWVVAKNRDWIRSGELGARPVHWERLPDEAVVVP